MRGGGNEQGKGSADSRGKEKAAKSLPLSQIKTNTLIVSLLSSLPHTDTVPPSIPPTLQPPLLSTDPLPSLHTTKHHQVVASMSPHHGSPGSSLNLPNLPETATTFPPPNTITLSKSQLLTLQTKLLQDFIDQHNATLHTTSTSTPLAIIGEFISFSIPYPSPHPFLHLPLPIGLPPHSILPTLTSLPTLSIYSTILPALPVCSTTLPAYLPLPPYL
jgi:hypothetical protein